MKAKSSIVFAVAMVTAGVGCGRLCNDAKNDVVDPVIAVQAYLTTDPKGEELAEKGCELIIEQFANVPEGADSIRKLAQSRFSHTRSHCVDYRQGYRYDCYTRRGWLQSRGFIAEVHASEIEGDLIEETGAEADIDLTVDSDEKQRRSGSASGRSSSGSSSRGEARSRSGSGSSSRSRGSTGSGSSSRESGRSSARSRSRSGDSSSSGSDSSGNARSRSRGDRPSTGAARPRPPRETPTTDRPRTERPRRVPRVRRTPVVRTCHPRTYTYCAAWHYDTVREPEYARAIVLSQRLDDMFAKAQAMCKEAQAGNFPVAYQASRELLKYIESDVKPDGEAVYASACKR